MWQSWTKLHQEEPVAANFDQYRDSYREVVQGSLALPGAEVDFFVRRKAQHLVDLASEVGAPGSLDVLDVGCGVGQTDRFLEGEFKALAGVDIASGLVERAAATNPWADYRGYSQEEPIPHPDRSFDLTFAVCVLHHVSLSDRERFISEMIRVTRLRGLVVIFEHNPWNPLTRRSVRNCEFDKGVALLPRREAKRLLEEQGLTTVRARYIVFFPRESWLINRMEHSIAWLPAGAQYYIAGRRPKILAAVQGAQ